MATPDFDYRSSEVEWSILQQYEHADNDGRMVCGMTGFDRRPDEVIYRGNHIDDFIGYFSIGQDSAEQLARLIGWVDPDDLEDVAPVLADLRDQVLNLQTEVSSRDEVIAAYELILGPVEADAE